MSKQKEKQLIQAAIDGMKNAFTGTNKPTDIRYGAAVLTKKGNIYSSGQYFSDTFSLTLHAEQAALAHTAAHGEYNIVAIAIIGNDPNDTSLYPCHMCKQLLWESHLRSKENTEVISLDAEGKVLQRIKLLDMITYPWPEK